LHFQSFQEVGIIVPGDDIDDENSSDNSHDYVFDCTVICDLSSKPPTISVLQYDAEELMVNLKNNCSEIIVCDDDDIFQDMVGVTSRIEELDTSSDNSSQISED